MQKLTKDYLLHGFYDCLTDENVTRDIRYVYIVRLTEYGMPLYERKEDTDAEMSSYFLVGSTQGRLLSSLDNLLNNVSCHCISSFSRCGWCYSFTYLELQVYTAVVKKQFKEPFTTKIPLKKQKTEIARRRSSDLTDFKRPSDYRRMALKMQKEKQKAARDLLLSEGEKHSLSEIIPSEQDVISSTPVKHQLIQDIEVMKDAVEWWVKIVVAQNTSVSNCHIYI